MRTVRVAVHQVVEDVHTAGQGAEAEENDGKPCEERRDILEAIGGRDDVNGEKEWEENEAVFDPLQRTQQAQDV